jgi:hypothetical protein
MVELTLVFIVTTSGAEIKAATEVSLSIGCTYQDRNDPYLEKDQTLNQMN